MWQTTFILIFILIFLLLHIANAEEASAQKFTNTFDKIRCKKEGKWKTENFETDFGKKETNLDPERQTTKANKCCTVI
jgi:hypothetical protein